MGCGMTYAPGGDMPVTRRSISLDDAAVARLATVARWKTGGNESLATRLALEIAEAVLAVPGARLADDAAGMLEAYRQAAGPLAPGGRR